MKKAKAPELTPNAEKLDRLIKRIDSGDVRIPAFQRGYVWKQDQILDLLDSVVSNYPVGSVLLWHTDARLKHTRNIAGYLIPENTLDYPVNYVLDGQQRISSLYAVFSDKVEQDEATDQYNPNLNIFEIYYDFGTSTFKPVTEVDVTASSIIYLKNLLDTTKLIPALSRLDSKYHTAASELCSKFLNYEIPVVTIKYRSKEEVGIIFERINNTGTKLSTVDLMTAWTWTDDFHLLEAANDLTEELEEKGFGKIPYNILLQAMSAALQDDTTTQAVLRLDAKEVRDKWDNFCEALRKAIDFLSTNLKCVNSDFLPFIQQLVAITKFHAIPGRITAPQIQALTQWFWKTSFSNRYATGATTGKMNVDIATVKEIRADNFQVVLDYSYTVNKSELIATQFSKGNSLTRALLLLMAQQTPVDLVKNCPIDLDRALSEYNRKEYHHIFPRAYLKKQGVSKTKINSTINFCFLPSNSNKQISRKAPSYYFFNLVPQDKFNDILSSNLLPLNKSIYQNDEFSTFLEKRSELIIGILDQITND